MIMLILITVLINTIIIINNDKYNTFNIYNNHKNNN